MNTHTIIGSSPAMQEVAEFIRRAAPTKSSVLIYGETGTGKELAARALHYQSKRANGPFVAVNCAALPEHLVESQLFGHEKGAFTDAVARQLGKFELASGGTLFLDEIGELSLTMQAKLLRALQERTIDRLGGSQSVFVDVRFIAATNRNLEQAVAEGRFREDLYWRLHVLTLRMPPLRERTEDIPELARHFLAGREISEEAMACLGAYPWPGNVRELQNAMEHAGVFGDLPAAVRTPLPKFEPRGAGIHEVMLEVQRWLLTYAFTAASGDYVRAAAILKVNPKSIHRSLKRAGLTHLID